MPHRFAGTAQGGAFIGGAFGAIKGTFLMLMGMVSIQALVQTVVLAFAGAVVGYYTTKLLRWIEYKIVKRK